MLGAAAMVLDTRGDPSGARHRVAVHAAAKLDGGGLGGHGGLAVLRGGPFTPDQDEETPVELRGGRRRERLHGRNMAGQKLKNGVRNGRGGGKV